MDPRERNQGLVLLAAGLLVMVLGVLLFGLTTASGAIDWVSVITAVAGLVMAITGLYRTFRGRGMRPPSRHVPHPAA